MKKVTLVIATLFFAVAVNAQNAPAKPEVKKDEKAAPAKEAKKEDKKADAKKAEPKKDDKAAKPAEKK